MSPGGSDGESTEHRAVCDQLAGGGAAGSFEAKADAVCDGLTPSRKRVRGIVVDAPGMYRAIVFVDWLVLRGTRRQDLGSALADHVALLGIREQVRDVAREGFEEAVRDAMRVA